MEAREFKLDISPKDPAQLSQEEQRLKAIKKILVGNQIERLENRFRGLSRRVETSNGQLVSTVEDLSEEFTRLKAEMKLRDPNLVGDSAAIQKSLEELLKSRKDLKLDDVTICQELEDRISTIESSIQSSTESKEQMNAMSEDIKVFKEKLKATQDRLSQVDLTGSPQAKAKVDKRLSSLEAKIKSLNPRKMEERLNKRQDEFEDGVQDLVERLAGRVNERFDFASKGRKKLADQQEMLANQQEMLANQQEVIADKTVELVKEQGQLKGRVDNIQELLENDIMNFLQNVSVDGGTIEQHVKDFAGDLERKMYENNVRMEAKIDAFIDMSSRQMRQAAPVQEDPKLKAVKDTLKQLSQLLNE